MKKQLSILAVGALLLGLTLPGCGAPAALVAEFPPKADNVAQAADGDGAIEVAEPDWSVYAPFDLEFNKKTDRLTYEGQRVRWFEDYWPIDECSSAGRDHLDVGGTVDVYATRDLTVKKVNVDGSYDPSGVLTGLAICAQEEFDKRDIEALKMPKTACYSERPATLEELAALYAVYAPYGLTYGKEADCLYYGGEKVGHFIDVLTSNGQEPDSGRFCGSLRSISSEDGTVSVRAVRDFEQKDKDGYGTLTGVEVFDRDDEK